MNENDILSEPSVFSLGGAYILLQQSDAEYWLGATADDSMHYDLLLNVIEKQLEQYPKQWIFQTELVGMPMLVIINSAMLYRIGDMEWLQVEAVANRDSTLTKAEWLEVCGTTPQKQQHYPIDLTAGRYYLFDSAWEFSEVYQDENYAHIDLDTDVHGITAQYYSTEKLDAWRLLLSSQ